MKIILIFNRPFSVIHRSLPKHFLKFSSVVFLYSYRLMRHEFRRFMLSGLCVFTVFFRFRFFFIRAQRKCAAMTLYVKIKLCRLLLVRTTPPGNLRGALEKDKLCFQWEAPLPAVFAHLQYEVGYQATGGEAWMVGCFWQWSFTYCIYLISVSLYQIPLQFFCVNISGRILCHYSTFRIIVIVCVFVSR